MLVSVVYKCYSVLLKVIPKKPPRRKPPQSSAMVKVEGVDKKGTSSSSDVQPSSVGDDTMTSVNTNNNDVNNSVFDTPPAVDNVIMQGVNNNYRCDTADTDRKLCASELHVCCLEAAMLSSRTAVVLENRSRTKICWC